MRIGGLPEAVKNLEVKGNVSRDRFSNQRYPFGFTGGRDYVFVNRQSESVYHDLIPVQSNSIHLVNTP